jgi:hypothetical protein
LLSAILEWIYIRGQDSLNRRSAHLGRNAEMVEGHVAPDPVDGVSFNAIGVVFEVDGTANLIL